MFVWTIVILKNVKILKTKKCIPIILFIILAIIAVAIQKINPGLLLITAVETFITVIMFFTIENPDMKLLEEVHKSKEISDAANEEKTLFLYNMTQEIRRTTEDINANADMILDSDSLEDDKDCAREIKGITSKFNSMTNELFDVSKLDAANIKVYNSKYNVKNIFKEIVTVYNKICNEVNLDFRVNIDHDVPEYMYGDSIGLKEVLNIILDNSVKYTKDGFIEFDVNTIVKNDVCRLIITIEDSCELKIKSPNVRRLEAKDKFSNDTSNITIQELVKTSLRMSPNRIIVGEVRDGTIIDVISAMSTGHEGSMSTAHANSPKNLLNTRIPMFYKMSGTDFSSEVIAMQVAEAIDVVVQTDFIDGKRRVSKISAITKANGVKIEVEDIFKFDTNKGFVSTEFIPKRILEKIKKEKVQLDKERFALWEV